MITVGVCVWPGAAGESQDTAGVSAPHLGVTRAHRHTVLHMLLFHTRSQPD